MGQGSSIIDTLGTPAPRTKQDYIVGKSALFINYDLEIVKQHVTIGALLPDSREVHVPGVRLPSWLGCA